MVGEYGPWTINVWSALALEASKGEKKEIHSWAKLKQSSCQDFFLGLKNEFTASNLHFGLLYNNILSSSQ